MVFQNPSSKNQRKLYKRMVSNMEDNGINISMFTYLEIYASNHNIDYLFQEVNMFQNTQNWKTSNRIVSSYHPPLA